MATVLIECLELLSRLPVASIQGRLMLIPSGFGTRNHIIGLTLNSHQMLTRALDDESSARTVQDGDSVCDLAKAAKKSKNYSEFSACPWIKVWPG